MGSLFNKSCRYVSDCLSYITVICFLFCFLFENLERTISKIQREKAMKGFQNKDPLLVIDLYTLTFSLHAGIVTRHSAIGKTHINRSGNLGCSFWHSLFLLTHWKRNISNIEVLQVKSISMFSSKIEWIYRRKTTTKYDQCLTKMANPVRIPEDNVFSSFQSRIPKRQQNIAELLGPALSI